MSMVKKENKAFFFFKLYLYYTILNVDIAKYIEGDDKCSLT